jgi:hypothetical protein
MSVSIFSYRGEVTIGLMADAALIPDPGEIVRRLEDEVEELRKLAPRRRTRRTPPRPRRAPQRRSAAHSTHS